MRKFIDCREYPSQSHCSLKISGEEEEVVRCATMHAVDVHGEHDGPELREMIRQSLRDEDELSERDESLSAARDDSLSAAQL